MNAGTAYLNAASAAMRDEGDESRARASVQAAAGVLAQAVEVLPNDAGAWAGLAMARMASRRQEAAQEAAAKAWALASSSEQHASSSVENSTGTSSGGGSSSSSSSSSTSSTSSSQSHQGGEAGAQQSEQAIAKQLLPLACQLVKHWTGSVRQHSSQLLQAAQLASRLSHSVEGRIGPELAQLLRDAAQAAQTGGSIGDQLHQLNL